MNPERGKVRIMSRERSKDIRPWGDLIADEGCVWRIVRDEAGEEIGRQPAAELPAIHMEMKSIEAINHLYRLVRLQMELERQRFELLYKPESDDRAQRAAGG